MAIIMVGAISLIYSAFSISLSERTKQMGLLKSIGATKKQIRHSVVFEACVLCMVGIPLGIAAGLGGIGITLHGISGLLLKLWSEDTPLRIHLVVTWQAIAIAVIVSFITVLISAMIPAAKAVRIPAIQAIRQSDDIKIRAGKATITHPIHIGKRMTASAPAGVSVYKWDEEVNVVLPYSLVKDGILRGVVDSEDGYTRYILMAKQHEKASTDLAGYFEEELSGVDAGTIVDAAASRDSDQALILILDIFSYGFIVLISLIAIANVFNTISTNVMLRRQEFAMLKSVGMTGKGFRRMMNYECILYGIKGLIFGLPVSLALSFLMYKSMVDGIDVSFMFPWQGMLISAFSVFAIVFITMLYAMRKVGKENTIEALRNENL